MDAVDGAALHTETLELARGSNYATFTTLMPDGHPQTQITWVDTDGDHLLINTPAGTQKARNVQRDPRVTVTVWDATNPFHYVEVRGAVTEVRGADQAAEHINRVAHKYFGGDYPQPEGRVLLVITAARQLLARPPAGPA